MTFRQVILSPWLPSPSQSLVLSHVVSRSMGSRGALGSGVPVFGRAVRESWRNAGGARALMTAASESRLGTSLTDTLSSSGRIMTGSGSGGSSSGAAATSTGFASILGRLLRSTNDAGRGAPRLPGGKGGSSGGNNSSSGGGGGGDSGMGLPSTAVALGLGIPALAILAYSSVESAPVITFQQFKTTYLNSDKVEKLEVFQKKKVRVYLKGSKAGPDRYSAIFNIGSVEVFERHMEEANIEYGVPPEKTIPIMYTNEATLPQILWVAAPTLVLVGFWMYAMRGASSGGIGPPGMMDIGKAKTAVARQVGIKTTFANIAGMDEAKAEVVEFVDFLRDSSRFQKLGAKVPRGALLVGPPGTGKTMLAKAVAGEAGVPFFSISGSDFLEMFVGVGPSRVRDLFKQARKELPAIIFIDEIDAIGRKRGTGGFGGGNDERENTLNQLLVEMDGFATTSGVVVLASTNRPDILDPALLRPGRFDRQISIDRPDIRGRRDIFKVHLAKIKIDDTKLDEYAERLATRTPGFVGADIANICNEAALYAARDDKSVVDLNHFESAIDRVIGGLEKKKKVLSPSEKKTVAYHEAGHAVAGWFLPHAQPLLKVSIIPRGVAALGYAQYIPKEHFLYHTEQLEDQMCMTLGGRISEKLFFDVVSTGAQDDLSKVTQMAYAQVSVYGMNKALGQLSFRQPEKGEMRFVKPFSEETSELIDREVRALVKKAYDRTEALLTEKKDVVEAVAQQLLKFEVLSKEDMIKIVGPRPFNDSTSFADLANLTAAERAESPRHAPLPETSGKEAPPSLPS